MGTQILHVKKVHKNTKEKQTNQPVKNQPSR